MPSVLDRFNLQERKDFLRLYQTPIFDLMEKPKDLERLVELQKRVSIEEYLAERMQADAATPQEVCLEITRKDPFRLSSYFGEIDLPDHMVPQELRKSPGKGYHKNHLYALVTADLSNKLFTSFEFRGYMKEATPEEIAQIPGIESLPVGKWPRMPKK